jgi:hypothetical protein
MFAIYVLITTKLKAFTIPGIIYTQKVFIMPRFFINKNVGIRPAFTYIERIMINVNGLRRTNSFLERAKASIAVKNTLVTILIVVLATEIKKAWGIARSRRGIPWPVWKTT